MNTSEAQAPETGSPEGEDKVKVAEEIGYAVLLVILIAGIVLVVLALLGPTIGNVASDIIAELLGS